MTFSLTILGSSSATPTLNRYPSAQVLNVHERLFLIDCGEGTQMQLRKMRIRIQRINHIFISHLHGDHYFGLVGLLFTFHLLGRTKEIHVYAPPEIQQIIDLQLKVANARLAYSIIFHPLQGDTSQIIYEDKKLTVSTIILNHRIPTYGFLFKEKQGERKVRKEILNDINIPVTEFARIKQGEDYIDSQGNIYKNEGLTIAPPNPRSYAYCSDTSFFEPIIEQIKGVDLLYHEATFMQDKASTATEKFHSTAIEAATIAQKAQVEKLILGHFSARYDDLAPLLEEAKTVFHNTFLAEDGRQFDV